MGGFRQDLRYAVRALTRNRALTLIIVVTLGLGLGANTAVFSFVNSILLRPLPFPHPDRLVTVCEENPEKESSFCTVSPRNLEDYGRLSRTVERFGAWRDWRFTMKGSEGAEGVPAGIASAGFFETLGVKAALGRTFLPDDERPGNNRVVVLSHDYWHTRFGGDPNLVGRTLRLDDELYAVIGILPADFEMPSLDWIGLWAPHTVDPDLAVPGRWLRNRRVVARLKPGVRIQDVRPELAAISGQLASQYPKDNAGWTARLIPLQEDEVGAARPALLVFMAAVGFVLLIACVNVANLLLARSVVRQRELALRASLGAGRWHLVRLGLIEGVLLSLLGGAAGLVVAVWAKDVFVALGPRSLPRLDAVRMDVGVFAFAFLLALVTGIVASLVPALHGARFNLSEALKEGQRSSGGPRGMRLRGALLVTETALALVLLTGTGLLAQTFLRMQALPLGFDPRNVIGVQVFLPLTKYPADRDAQTFYQRITAELESLPGVVSVGSTSSGPLFGGREPAEFTIEGRPKPAPGQNLVSFYHNISPGYFRTLSIPLLAGRDFTGRDGPGAPPVVIINQSMARRYWPSEDPLGQRITLAYAQLAGQPLAFEVVGVVGDTQRLRMDGLVEPEMYWCYLQQVRWASYFLVRTASDPAPMIPAVRGRLAALDPDLLVSRRVWILSELVARSLGEPRFNVLLVGIFAGAALLLAVVGIYGVVTYSVTERTHELGVRAALGAQPGQLLRLVLAQGMRFVVAGLAIGAVAALALTRYMKSLLFGVTPADPATFVAVALVLAAAGALASSVPAWRASQVDPAHALRYE